jgi:hypothetical protein
MKSASFICISRQPLGYHILFALIFVIHKDLEPSKTTESMLWLIRFKQCLKSKVYMPRLTDVPPIAIFKVSCVGIYMSVISLIIGKRGETKVCLFMDLKVPSL